MVSVRGKLVGEFSLACLFVFNGKCQGMMWILVVRVKGYLPSRWFAAAVVGVDQFMTFGQVRHPRFCILKWLEMVSWCCLIHHWVVQIGTNQGAIGQWRLRLPGWVLRCASDLCKCGVLCQHGPCVLFFVIKKRRASSAELSC